MAVRFDLRAPDFVAESQAGRSHLRYDTFGPIQAFLGSVQAFFGLQEAVIRRGTYHSVPELERAIYQWLANWNHEPQPFIWKATADVFLDKVRRCKELAGT